MPVFDATALLYFLEPDANAPLDPAINGPVTDAKARIDFLIRTLQNRNVISPHFSYCGAHRASAC